ncbi:MAG: shikimate dehydrogenase [Ruminiclostridium sp.]|nr:shikimate dehydrogenase [Ruminiclostridium sp.]
MKTYGILGYPLGHSLSPQIHERLFALSGVKTEYKIFEIPAEELKSNFEMLKGTNGFNITIPHKIGIIDMCDSLDDTAKRYTSVNCVDVKDGKVTGYNTDCVGFTLSIKAMGATLSEKTLMLGCGGVGRMIAIETVRSGGDITIAVREEDIETAKKMCEELKNFRSDVKADYCLLSEVKGEYALVVNATPVGMYPKTEFSPISEEALGNITTKHFFDVIYNPLETKLMSNMRAKGVKVSGGMDMLVWQAVAAHTIWDGSQYDEKDIKQLIEDMKELV